MSAERTADGFARQLKHSTTQAPPPRPAVPSTPAVDLEIVPDPPPTVLIEGEADQTVVSEEAEPTTAPTDKHVGGGVGRPEMVTSGAQLTPEQIDHINKYAKTHGLYKQNAFHRLCREALAELGSDLVIPPEPIPQGPDDHAYHRRLALRIEKDLLKEVDAIADQQCGGNRSHVFRHLINFTCV